jgi:Na+-transporting methylmalonyl-CoA/oxaloacetate decarboxylase gamma subunit
VSVDLVLQTLGLAVVGMATVFCLLGALIAAVVVMSRLVDGRRQPVPLAQARENSDAQPEMAAAVAAAIRHHRARAAAGAGTAP